MKFQWQTIDYFSLSTFGDFGGLEWSKAESRFDDEVAGGQYENQHFGKGEVTPALVFLNL